MALDVRSTPPCCGAAESRATQRPPERADVPGAGNPPWTALGAAALVGGAAARWFRLGRRRRQKPPVAQQPPRAAPVRASAAHREVRQALGLAASSLAAALVRSAVSRRNVAISAAPRGRQPDESVAPEQPHRPLRALPERTPASSGEERPERPGHRAHRAALRPQSWWALLKQTFSDFVEDKAPQLGASLAYYTIFSLAPLLVIGLSIAGLVFGEEAARGQISTQLQEFLGPEGAAGVEQMLDNANRPGTGLFAGLVGIVVLLFGASGVFGQLQDALNTIWEVQPKAGRGIWGTIRDRFWSFAMVLGIGFLLLVSLLLSTVLTAVSGTLGDWLPGPDLVAHAVNFLVSFVVVTLLFALIFKLLPDVKIAWGDVWIGAVATAILFAVGKYLIGLYLGHSAISSTYGAAASLVIVLVWAYYSSQILFLGAEFTQAYSRMYGSRYRPAEDAEWLTADAKAEQGRPTTKAK